MSIVILHHDLEPTEKRLEELFKDREIDVNMFDVRDVDISDFVDADLVLNRVYASVANRDYASIDRTLNLIQKLEEQGLNCLNSYMTSLFDYNKFESYIAMKNSGIKTPETRFVQNQTNISDLFEDISYEFTFPIIIKRNTGGRGKDISKVFSRDEFFEDLDKKFNLAYQEKYMGDFIIQEFINSSRDYDCRIGIIDGEFVFSYKRSLISKKEGEIPWLASVSNGSIEGEYEAQEKEIILALNATKSIGARFNELDVMFTENGPCIIENNPTPNYITTEIEDQKRMELFIDIIKNSLNPKKNEE